jgi:hypothetical protein
MRVVQMCCYTSCTLVVISSTFDEVDSFYQGLQVCFGNCVCDRGPGFCCWIHIIRPGRQ